MKLILDVPAYYRLKRGQTLADCAAAFGLTPRLLAVYNRLTEEPFFGQVLKIPPAAGDLYTVRGGETRSLLCGSPAVFRQKNGTDCLYIGQTVLL